MNNNFTHWKSKNPVSKVSGFFTNLSVLPASPWFAVNSLLAGFFNLLMQTFVSKSGISESFKGNQQHTKFIPLYTVQEFGVIKNQFSDNRVVK